MLRLLCLLLMQTVLYQYSYSQKQGYIWTFGDSAAIDFNYGNPVPILGTGIASSESSAISNYNGKLLFYAGVNSYSFNYNEIIVFNEFNQIVSNGTGIYGNYSSTQGCLLLPDPGDTNKIYLFTQKQESSPFNSKIYFSIIDKSANSDSGSVILKNIQLSGINDMSEHLCAVRHGNGKDWWLICHMGNGNQFFLYLIDSSGIQGPFIQSIGSFFPYVSATGQLKISPDGGKLLMVTSFNSIDLFEFNRCTGMLSDWHQLSIISSNVVFNHYYGGSFSPNSQVLYVSKIDSGLFQYDLQAADIKASRQLIWTKPDTSGIIGQHLLGPDGKIYIANSKPANMSPGIFNVENMNLSVINSPDSLGLACDFQPYSFNLGGRRSFYGLPNIPDYKLLAVEGGCDSVVSVTEVISVEKKISVHPNPANDKIFISNKTNEDFHLEIFDLAGRVLLQMQNKFEVDVTELKQGIYFYRIIVGENIESGKFSIIK
jgi:hypothetical protein